MGSRPRRSAQSVKLALSQAPTLTYFDPAKPVLVSADASSYGIGAVLMQKEEGVFKPVAFASRTLLPAETRYAQIEKECLAAVWACEKFDRYLCGLNEYNRLIEKLESMSEHFILFGDFNFNYILFEITVKCCNLIGLNECD